MAISNQKKKFCNSTTNIVQRYIDGQNYINIVKYINEICAKQKETKACWRIIHPTVGDYALNDEDDDIHIESMLNVRLSI